ncbi:MAG: amidohydrolase [Methanobacteriota archaeon]|nr:MAG: amidohydrolase [Euryarchaeota archaeon]
MLERDGVEKGVVINYVAPEVMGFTFKTNDWVINFCDQSNGRLIPVGGVDTKANPNAGELLKPYFETESLKMIKVHGPHQLINPNDYLSGNEGLYNLYSTCEEFGIPVLFHTGSSIFPKARSRYGNPLMLEDVLIDFPDLKVIVAHGGRPFWTREFEYLMLKYPKLYFDVSGVPPKLIGQYFPRLKRYAKRIIFGSDFPSPGVKGIRKNAELLEQELLSFGIAHESLDLIFYKNALDVILN